MSFVTPQALTKKRNLAEERRRRLACHKNRTIGIDVEALEEQVKEKAERQKEEHERDDYFAEQALLMDRHAQALQEEMDTQRRDRNKGVEEYRKTFQRKEGRREWDLNDPSARRKELPVRLCDADPRLGVSCAQVLQGEDLDAANRRRAQQQQQKAWADQQTDEKLLKKWKEREADREYEERSEEMAFRTHQIEQSIADQRRQVAITTAEFNKQLAAQKKREQEMEKARMAQKNLEEIDNMLNSDFLSEVEGTQTMMGAKLKRDRFKGLTDDHRASILRQQAEQRELLAKRRLNELQEERQLAAYEAMQNRMAVTLDRQKEREKRLANQQLAQEQRQQASEAALRKKSLDALYRNQVGDEFFRPFGDYVC